MFSHCRLLSPIVHVENPGDSSEHQPFHIEWPSGLLLPHQDLQTNEPLDCSTKNPPYHVHSLIKPQVSHMKKKTLSKKVLTNQTCFFSSGCRPLDCVRSGPATRKSQKTRYPHRQTSHPFPRFSCLPFLLYRPNMRRTVTAPSNSATPFRRILETKLKSYHRPRLKDLSPESLSLSQSSGPSSIVIHALQNEVVISEILKYFEDDPKILGALSLVNRAWRMVADSYLFLHLNVSQWIKLPEEIRKRQASVARAIHFDKVSREGIAQFLKFLENNTFPRLNTLHSDDWTRALRGEHVRRLFPSSLQVLQFPLETRFIANIITDQCHSLKILHLAILHHDNRASDHLLIDMLRMSSSTLQDISITGSGSQLCVTATIFSVLASLPSLKALQLGCKITNLNIPDEMPRAAFQSLESLTAPFNNTAYARVMPYLRAIKHLDVSIDDGTRALEILTTFRCVTLESLRVNSREGVLLGIDIPEIAQLNPGLHTLIVGYDQQTSSFSISLTDVHIQNTVRARPNLRVLRLQSKNMVELTDTSFDRIAEYLDQLEELELPESGLPIDLGNLSSRSHALRFPRLIKLDIGPLLLNATPRNDIVGFVSSCTPRLKRLGRYEIGNGIMDFRS